MDYSPSGLKRPAESDPVAGTATTLRQQANSVQGQLVAVTSASATTVTQAVTFPVAFASAPAAVVVTPLAASPNLFSTSIQNITSTGCEIRLYRTTGSGAVNVYVMSIGKGLEVGG